MSTVDPSDVAVRFPHGLGELLVLKGARLCPCCAMFMKVWVDTGSAAACMGCLTGAALSQPRRPPHRAGPNPNTQEQP